MDQVPEIYLLYTMKHDGQDMHRALTGKFMLDHNGKIHVLEDHDGHLKDVESMDPANAAKYLQSLQDGMYTELVPANDVMSGKRSDLIPTAPLYHEDLGEMPVTYSYKRIGMEAPQELVFHQGKASLDGYELSNEELARLLDNVKKERATLDKLPSAGIVDADMVKSDQDLYQALGHMRQAVKAGTLHPDALRTISNHVFKDTMVPSVGNRKAYEDFLSRPRKGVHIHLDANDFGSINKQHGFAAGDEAIKSYGTAIRNAVDESVGRKDAKVFRVGGDEIMVHVPSHEHAARFIRSLKSHFNKIAPIGGTHNISSSVGVGESPQTAEHALIQAKTAKKALAYPLGQAKTHAYSSIPGFEGHIATE